MTGAEQRQLPYVFKLKQSANVKKLIDHLFGGEGWIDAGQKWQGLDSRLQLTGWSQERRVIVLRRALPQPTEKEIEKEKKGRGKTGRQMILDLPETTHAGVRYEYAVLVTSLPDEVRTIAQHYRDRGDAENNFDELKN